MSVDDVQSALQSNTSELSKIFQSMLTAMNNQSSLAKVQQEEINVLKSEMILISISTTIYTYTLQFTHHK